MIDALAAGRHVVIEFGQHNNSLAYMLVANIITRRIHRRWVDQTNRFLESQNPADRPKQLMITIEEAHKFLNPATAKQTIFGTIARELRKYSVTLLVVDQRPSSIDNEVMSQLGTRITALLNDEKDIDAVFTGVSGGQRAQGGAGDPGQQAAGPGAWPCRAHAGGDPHPPLRRGVLRGGGAARAARGPAGDLRAGPIRPGGGR